MELTTLYKQYRAAKLAADQAAKEEDKLKKALKKAMEEAGVKNYTDEDGFLFAKVLEAIEAGEYTAEELQKYLTVKEVVMLKLTDPAKVKK